MELIASYKIYVHTFLTEGCVYFNNKYRKSWYNIIFLVHTDYLFYGGFMGHVKWLSLWHYCFHENGENFI
jgi:hypothetical protein